MDTSPPTALDRLAALAARLPQAPDAQDLAHVARAVRSAADDGATPDEIAAVGHLSLHHVLRLLASS